MFKIIGCSMLGLTSFAFSGCRDAYTGGGGENNVGTMQLIAGVAEMLGGGVLAGLGVIEIGETVVLGGGGSFGLAIGAGMLGLGIFGLVDGSFRSSIPNYTFDDSINLAEGVGELTGGAFLAFKGVESAFEVYNGNQFSYFELGMAVGGLGGGGYLLWDGYDRIYKILYPPVLTPEQEKIVYDFQKGMTGSIFGSLGVPKSADIEASKAQQKAEDLEKSIKKGQEVMGNLFSLGTGKEKVADEKSIRGLSSLGVKNLLGKK